MCISRDIALFCGCVGLANFLRWILQVFHTKFGRILNGPDFLLVVDTCWVLFYYSEKKSFFKCIRIERDGMKLVNFNGWNLWSRIVIPLPLPRRRPTTPHTSISAPPSLQAGLNLLDIWKSSGNLFHAELHRSWALAHRRWLYCFTGLVQSSLDA